MKILITSGSGIVGAAIRWYTWSWAAHAAFELDDGLILDALSDLGVSIHPPRKYVREERFTVDCEPVVVERALAFAHDQLWKPYDFSAIAGMVVRHDWRNPDRWFCSELVAAAFEAAGCPLVHAEALDRISPRDLLMSPLLRPA